MLLARSPMNRGQQAMMTNQILARRNGTAVVSKGMQQQIVHIKIVNNTSMGDKATNLA